MPVCQKSLELDGGLDSKTKFGPGHWDTKEAEQGDYSNSMTNLEKRNTRIFLHQINEATGVIAITEEESSRADFK